MNTHSTEEQAAYCLPDMSGVLYRTGLTDRDYDEAITALRDAKKQKNHKSHGCSVCYDSGHTAEQCHHNPLVMARRATIAARVWRCFHCDAVFTDAEKAQEHFGNREAIVHCCQESLKYRAALERLADGDHPGTPINKSSGAMKLIEEALGKSKS